MPLGRHACRQSIPIGLTAARPASRAGCAAALDDPPCTDFVFALPEAGREAVVRTFRNTNYAVVDPI